MEGKFMKKVLILFTLVFLTMGQAVAQEKEPFSVADIIKYLKSLGVELKYKEQPTRTYKLVPPSVTLFAKVSGVKITQKNQETNQVETIYELPTPAGLYLSRSQ
jgi:hypothetical protein